MTASKNPLTTRVSEISLKQKLRKKMLSIFVILGISVLALSFFAPQIGSFFGIFSKYRNDPGYVPTAKPIPPVFIDALEATNQEKITLSGKALSGSTIKIFVNGPERGSTTTGADGVFSFSDIKINLGTNTIFAKAFDDKGNESDNSEFLIIKYDKSAPEIEITSPKDGDTVRNLNKRVEITGKINEKATITINERTVIQRSDFSFDFILGTDEGSVEIKIEAMDMAGNKSEKKIKVKYVKGS